MITVELVSPRPRRTFLILGVVAIVGLGIGLGAWQPGSITPQNGSQPTSGRVLGVQASSEQAIVAGAGRIVGWATNVAGMVPPDFMVCAEPTLGGPASCVTPGSDGQFNLDLAPGQYHVSAYTKNAPTLRGHYTERSAGLEDGSKPTRLDSVDPRRMIVNVGAGQTLENINPDDWS